MDRGGPMGIRTRLHGPEQTMEGLASQRALASSRAMALRELDPTTQANRRGAALMLGSMTAFTVNDAFMKTLGMEWPLFQSLFIRGIFAVLIMGALAAYLGHLRLRLPRRDRGLVAIRSACEAAAAGLFIHAIFNMPLAEATAILQTLPLTVTLAGALFLGEAVGWRRWAAILVGFLGVLFIVQPGGAGFTPVSLYAVAAVLLITGRDIAARRMSEDVPSLLAALAGAVAVMALGALGSTTEDWQPLTLRAAMALAGAVCTIFFAYLFSVAAMRSGDIGFVAPYRYSALLVALLLGIVVFGEVPGPLTLLGAALITASGIYTLLRENRAREAA
ncbi:MAG: DMT family transporter [Pseudomonadota bacterium]